MIEIPLPFINYKILKITKPSNFLSWIWSRVAYLDLGSVFWRNSLIHSLCDQFLELVPYLMLYGSRHRKWIFLV
jgi:hypothetical protein